MNDLPHEHDEIFERIDRTKCMRFFISGTYDDLAVYRQRIAESLKRLSHEPFDPMENISSHESVCAFAERQIKTQADAYIGFFGVRYGCFFAADDDSLTSYSEYEYNLACEHWGKKPLPPIFILLPKPETPLYREIEARAVALLSDRDKRDQAWIDRDAHRQKEFLLKVTGDLPKANRIVKYIDLASDIAARTEHCVRVYTTELFALGRSAARMAHRRSHSATETPPILNQESVSAADAALRTFHSASNQALLPGLCLLIHGARGRGHSAFAKAIIRKTPWEVLQPHELEFVAPRANNNHEIWEALWGTVGMYPENGNFDDVQSLAKQIVLADRPLLLVLKKMNLTQGGPQRFATSVWQPLYDALLKQLPSSDRRDRRQFLSMLLTYEGAPPGMGGGGLSTDWKPDAKADYRKVLVLPAL